MRGSGPSCLEHSSTDEDFRSWDRGPKREKGEIRVKEIMMEEYYKMIIRKLKDQGMHPDLEEYYHMRIRGIKDQGIHPDLADLEDRVD